MIKEMIIISGMFGLVAALIFLAILAVTSMGVVLCTHLKCLLQQLQ